MAEIFYHSMGFPHTV